MTMDASLGPPLREFSSTRGALTIWMPAHGLLVTRSEGHIDSALATAFIAAGNDVVSKDGRLMGFHDWLNVNNYASDARNRLTQWGYDIRANVDHVYFLTGSPILRMGIAVASIVLKEMLIVFTDRGAFEQELRAALRERRNAAVRLSIARSG
jgi:hypothetical protein